MSIQEVLSNLLRNNWRVLLKQIGVAGSRFRGDLERDMKKLSNIRIEAGVSGNMPNGIGKFRADIDANDASGWQLASIDIDHARVRTAQLINVRQCVGVNLAASQLKALHQLRTDRSALRAMSCQPSSHEPQPRFAEVPCE